MNFKPELLEKIKHGAKFQTRRILKWNQHFYPLTKSVVIYTPHSTRIKWQVGCSYAGCPGRGKRSECRILILDIRVERLSLISAQDALAEGGYTVDEFLALWDSINGTGKRDIDVAVLTFTKKAESI